ncbi:MAG: serine/threonine protein phosphatase [Treponema sp.]|nr:serine/threonine protein phosphatase [Treponema sp.]
MSKFLENGATLDLRKGKGNGKLLIISDFHMGSGRRDDFRNNGEIAVRMLEKYYFKKGWTLILNGDIEELAKNSLSDIQREWADMYRVFDLFSSVGRLYKTLGNHDEGLIFEKDYPYPLYNSVCIETGIIPIYVYHGHQSSVIYTVFNSMLKFCQRYFLKPMGIRNISSARSPRRRFKVERHAYNFSIANNCISVIGHTHRALFEGRKQSLYGDVLPLPCLFNSGSAIGKKGIHAIELDKETIALVYWFAKGSKVTLNKERLDYISSKLPSSPP